MRLIQVVDTSAAVGATPARTGKAALLAELLREAASGGAPRVEVAVGFLIGEPRQGRIGVGWRTLAAAEQVPADEPNLTIEEVDAALTDLAEAAGPGSVLHKRAVAADLLARSTAAEQAFLHQLVSGGLRQGASAGVMADAVAKAAGIPATVVRRAVMLGGRLDVIAGLALIEGQAAVEAVALEVGRPIQPMLASTSPTATEALVELGEAAVQWKLDGIRIQVHRSDDDIRVYSRNLNDITDQLPEVVRVARGLPARSFVLDGEALHLDPESGRPAAFQDTRTLGAAPFFFDVVHLDGHDLLDRPLDQRLATLDALVGDRRIPGTTTADPEAAEAVLADALAAGHEGVVVKGVGSTYEAGRRGKAWRKVKPVHTLDLVVLAVEWGHGRRRGWLSNLHLGARTDHGFVMVGKTFKGLTDQLLAWQTERFLEIAERTEPWDGPQTGVVWVRPEQVVEIALDGVQRSTRYPGGVALRFARVVRYRHDKGPDAADRLETVQAFLR